jgi:hypothetical protein
MGDYYLNNISSPSPAGDHPAVRRGTPVAPQSERQFIYSIGYILLISSKLNIAYTFKRRSTSLIARKRGSSLWAKQSCDLINQFYSVT